MFPLNGMEGVRIKNFGPRATNTRPSYGRKQPNCRQIILNRLGSNVIASIRSADSRRFFVGNAQPSRLPIPADAVHKA
jgi:hypothetical protein